VKAAVPQVVPAHLVAKAVKAELYRAQLMVLPPNTSDFWNWVFRRRS
jgi:hypothetical protein